MPVKSISTIQAKQVLDGTHYLQIYNGSGGPPLIFDIEGEVSSTTGNAYYIQLLNTNAPSSGVTIPIYSRLAVSANEPTQNNGFSFIYRPRGLDTSIMTQPPGGTVTTDGSITSNIYIAISSTDNVYTSVAASTQVTVDIEDTYLEIPTQTITGDLVTPRDALTVWADPGASHKIIQLQYQSGQATTNTPNYIQIFASSPVVNQIPLQEITVTDQNVDTIRFGSGFSVQGQGAPTLVAGLVTIPIYTLHTGCYIAGSTTPGYLTATTGGEWFFKAWNI
jgi:hypothetical protein